MDRVLEILRPHLEPLARPFADSGRPVESTSDLLQDSCLRAWKKIGSFRGGEGDEDTFNMFRAWVGQIVRNIGLTAQRDRGRQKRNPEQKVLSIQARRPGQTTAHGEGMDPPSLDPSPSAHARVDEKTERVREALGRLDDETDAAILRMRLIEGLDLTEIAKRLDLGYKKVWNRYQATIKQLQKSMKGMD